MLFRSRGPATFGTHPRYMSHGAGARLYDVDGNSYIDWMMAFGALPLGHGHPKIVETVAREIARGSHFATALEVEVEVAEILCRLLPHAGKVRFANTGTEAAMAAFRLARGLTGRRKIIKFEGHYHGWLDNVLLSVGPTAEAGGPADAPNLVPGSPGMDPLAAKSVNVLPWNNLEKLKERLAKRDVAAVIMEPAMCNTSAIRPKDGYLDRKSTRLNSSHVSESRMPSSA